MPEDDRFTDMEYGPEMRAYSKALADFEETVKKLSIPRSQFRKLPPIAQVKLAVLSAYTMCACHYAYLRSQGHEIGEESKVLTLISRVKTYMKKIGDTQMTAKENQIKTQLMGARVDKEAAKRLIQHHTGAKKEEAEDVDAEEEEEGEEVEEVEEIEEVEEVEEDLDDGAAAAAPPAKRQRAE
eukprot:Hpha_TRINITY_DN16103_c0_g3::TRINITY_DN16103_c0_g3_i1::g.7524::m.7524/K12592/C1D, LRP1; exosome complex protein LRP1